MTRETFDKLTKGVMGLTRTAAQASPGWEATPASQIINCIRYWKHKIPVPVRLVVVLDDGMALDCRFPQELALWRAWQSRGLLGNVAKLIPPELAGKI